jgi:hypothetical protein
MGYACSGTFVMRPDGDWHVFFHTIPVSDYEDGVRCYDTTLITSMHGSGPVELWRDMRIDLISGRLLSAGRCANPQRG